MSLSLIVDDVPAFAGFPYLVTRLQSALYHIIPLPSDVPESLLYGFAQKQLEANRLKQALVLGGKRATFYLPDGKEYPAGSIPSGGIVLEGLLAPVIPLPYSTEMADRWDALREFANHRNLDQGVRYVGGDPVRAGRPMRPDELEALTGVQDNGVPKGLALCPECGDWNGECIDPEPKWDNLVIRVRCRCENENRCARCHQPLTTHGIQTNYYDPATRKVWFVPGFCVFEHRCGKLPYLLPRPVILDVQTFIQVKYGHRLEIGKRNSTPTLAEAQPITTQVQ